MKRKVLFVAPYAAMVNLVEECSKEEPKLDIQIKVGNLHEGVRLAEEAQDVDLIISRGGTAKLIGEAVDIPVIGVPVSGYDMLRVLTIANDFPSKKAIVGFSTITLGAKSIIDLLEIPIDIFTIEHEDETEPLLNQLKQDGYQLIMGDVVTYETASRLGLIGILIQSGREAIFDAFKEAKMVSRWMFKSQLEIDRLKSILKVTANDFMVLSENGDIIYEQWKSFNGCPINDYPVELNTEQNNGINREVTQIADCNGERVKIIKTKMLSNDSPIYIYEFVRVKVEPNLYDKMEVSVLTPPRVVRQSKAIDECLNIIDGSLFFKHFVLIGKTGTGKELVSKYIHYNKYDGSGLYASISAIDFLGLNTKEIDQDIKTVYIHSTLKIDENLMYALWERIKDLKQLGITIILAITEESPLWGDMIYSDEVVCVSIPPLNERKEDIKELATSFLLHFNQTLGTSVIKINEKGLAILAEYDWPGNVDELRAMIKEAVLMEKEYVIDDQLIEQLIDRKVTENNHQYSDLLTGTLESIEKKIIETVLREEDFNQTRAAKRLNINRATLWRKLKK